MVSQAGAVFVISGYVTLKLNRINVFVACSLLLTGTMLCHTSIFLEILTIENIYKFKVALFTHKITNNAANVSTILKGTLTLAPEIHYYNTRFASNLNSHREWII